MDQTPVPGPVPGVTVLQRELRTGHGDQIFLNFSNCLSPGSTFSRNLWDFVRGYLLKKRNYNAIMPHESLSRSLEYTNKIIAMEVENHYVPRNELFWLANTCITLWRLHRSWWRMLETKNVLVTTFNCWWRFWLVWSSTPTNSGPLFKRCHQHRNSVTKIHKFKSPTSTCHQQPTCHCSPFDRKQLCLRSEHEKLETELITAKEKIEQLEKELKLMKETQVGFWSDSMKLSVVQKVKTNSRRASFKKPI